MANAFSKNNNKKNNCQCYIKSINTFSLLFIHSFNLTGEFKSLVILMKDRDKAMNVIIHFHSTG